MLRAKHREFKENGTGTRNKLLSSTELVGSLAGIPVFALSHHSLAYPVANHSLEDIETPAMPDRTAWLQDLAYAQWRNIELANGDYWRHFMAHHPVYLTGKS